MKLYKSLSLAAALLAAVSVASANVVFYSQTFDDAASIAPWNPGANSTASDKAWLETGGNPGGAMQISGNNPGPGGAAYIFNLSQPTDFQGFTDITFTFDAMITQPLVGAAIHVELNQMGPAGAANPNNFFDIQGLLNDTSFTTLSFEIANVPANADTLFIGFNLAAGAFAGAGGAFAIDNISISAIPEPSTYAALIGLLALAVVMIRRRSKPV